MLDKQLLRKNLTEVAQQLKNNRGIVLDIKKYSELESKRKELQTLTESTDAILKALDKEFGFKAAKYNKERQQQLEQYGNQSLPMPSDKGREWEGIEQSHISNTWNHRKRLDEQKIELNSVKEELKEIENYLPNLPHESVPVGKDEADNVEVRKVGTPRTFDFAIKDHTDVGTPLGLDFDTGAKLSGARFTLMRGQIAKLHRALAQFMIDTQTEQHGYEECYTP